MTTLTYNDPRAHQGDPYEVAGFAVAQAITVLDFYARALADAEAMARNAWMSREIDLDRDPDAAAWPATPEGRRYEEALHELRVQRPRLVALAAAAAWDPNATVDG